MPLGEHVERVLTEGAAAHPSVTTPRDLVRRLVAKRLQDEEGRGSIDTGELYLAAACALGDKAAIGTFETRYIAAIPAALAALALSQAEIAQVLQALRVRLFAGTRRSKSVTLHSGPSAARLDPFDATADSGAPGELPRVVAYAGQGGLAALVRVAAIRGALALLQSRVSTTAVAGALEVVPVREGDPALAALAERHRAHFGAAFDQALASLDSRDRNLLGLAVVRGLSLDRIGAIYSIHSATAARWVTAARTNLTRELHRLLAETLGLPADAAEGYLPLVEAQLELSLERLLQGASS